MTLSLTVHQPFISHELLLTGTVLDIRNTNKNPLENSETQDTILHHILTWKYNEVKEEEVFFKLDQDENSINYYLDEMERT